jgi:hypothetical protein
MQPTFPMSPHFRDQSLHIYTNFPENITVVCRIDCFAYQDEFFINNSLDVKENYLALDFAHPCRLCGHGRFGLFHSDTHVWLMLSSSMLVESCLACLIRVSVILFLRFAQSLICTLCWIHRKITTGQIHDSK